MARVPFCLEPAAEGLAQRTLQGKSFVKAQIITDPPPDDTLPNTAVEEQLTSPSPLVEQR